MPGRPAGLRRAASSVARTLSLTAILSAALGLGAPAPALGQGWIEPPRPDPSFGVERLRTHVEIRIEGRVAHVEVEEWFRNGGRGLAEGVYLYPLSGEASFGSFSLFQGDEELTGETMDAARAREIYEGIVRQQKDPALIELVGHGLLRARVFPFQAGETRRITLRYTQLLGRAGDAVELRHAAGVRASARRGLPEILPPGRGGEGASPLTFTVTVEDGVAFLDPFSPTHEVRVSREEGRIRVRPAGELSGDFALFLPLSGDRVRLSLATHRPSSEDGYFMLTLSPAAVAASSVPRDVTAVVDVSGSMSGEKMEQTRRALVQLLGTLGERDRFRLIRFSSGVATWRPDWTPATPAELAAARTWIEDLRAQGATNISGALEEAFRAETPPDRLPIVVFLTDGIPTVGETNPERIAAQAEELRGRARLFALGVGYDVDTHLLDRLAGAGMGSVGYVAPGEDVELALGVLAAKIQHPVLADLALDDRPVELREIHPAGLPDLFVGEELTLFGRYVSSGEGTLGIRGERNGRTERFAVQAAFPEHALANDFIPRLWAARKIGELTRAVRMSGPDPELVEEIRTTALRYGILTEYTSYLVLEPGVTVAGGRGRMPPAALSAVGEDAVHRAEAARMAREVRSQADVDRLATLSTKGGAGEHGPGAGQPGSDERRIVAGRAFTLEGGVWVDALHEEERPVVRIQAFSEAYFELLRALPELRGWWRELPSVRVAGAALSLEVGEEGKAALSASELERLVQGFRGP